MFHKHLIIRAEINNPIVDPSYMSETWLPNLIETIGMKVLGGPYSIYCDVEGNRGLTAVAIIETSHVALHIWDEAEPAMLQLDVYTCGHLDPYDVVSSIQEMEPVLIEMKYLDREHKLVELPIPLPEE
jgi:S-adenosylmethionine/arginine decarboxylase-like enzyme